MKKFIALLSAVLMGTTAIASKEFDSVQMNGDLGLFKGSTATLTARTRKQGVIYFDTSLGVPVYDTGAALSAFAGGGGGSTEFSDDVFRLKDDGDATKKVAFEVSAVTTGTTRTITMPNAAVNLTDVNNAVLVGGTRPFTANQSFGGFKATSLLDPTLAQDAATKAYVDLGDTGSIKANGSVAFAANQSLGTFKFTNLGYGTAASDSIRHDQAVSRNDGVSDFDASAVKIINLADPSGLQDAATKSYVDSVAGAVDVPDSTFRVHDDGDATKKLALEVSSITTGTVRTWTVTDTNLSFSLGAGGSFANANLSNLASPTSINQNLIPSADNSKALGSNTLRWNRSHQRRLSVYNGTAGEAGIELDVDTSATATPSGETIGTNIHTFNQSIGGLGIYTEGNVSGANSDPLYLETGNNDSTSGSFNSGVIKRKTGAITNAGNAGSSMGIFDVTGNVAGSGDSGDIWQIIGTVTSGTRGGIMQQGRVVDQSLVEEGLILANLGADPATNVAGTLYYDTTTGNLRMYDDFNSVWKFVGDGAGGWTSQTPDQVMIGSGIPLLEDGVRAVGAVHMPRTLVWESDFFAATESAFWNTNSVGSSPTSGYHSLFVSSTSPGIWLDGSGLDVTGRVVHYTSSSIMLGAATVHFYAKVRPEDLATTPQNFRWFFGLGNTFTDSTEFTNGIYFKYNHSTSDNWLCGTVASATATETDSGVPVTTADFAWLEYVVDPSASQVEFFIDGVSVCTTTTNIPSTSAALNGVYKFFKTNGDDERRVVYDYTGLRMDFLNER